MHARQYLAEVALIAQQIHAEDIEKMATELVRVRDDGGRLFFLGVGGSAANASHATNDFASLPASKATA
jgi:D-sedoheptulose 7-phosphate isomerase